MLRDLVDILQALLTPLIAVIALGIAFAQWWTARNRFKLDLFDRRWAIYVVTREMLGELFTHARSSPEAQRAYLQGIRGAEWLFDTSIEHYLRKELWQRIAHLEGAVAMLDAQTPEADRVAASKKKWEIMQWVVEQDPIVDAMFGEFLKMDETFLTWLRGRLRQRLRTKVSRSQVESGSGVV